MFDGANARPTSHSRHQPDTLRQRSYATPAGAVRQHSSDSCSPGESLWTPVSSARALVRPEKGGRLLLLTLEPVHNLFLRDDQPPLEVCFWLETPGARVAWAGPASHESQKHHRLHAASRAPCPPSHVMLGPATPHRHRPAATAKPSAAARRRRRRRHRGPPGGDEADGLRYGPPVHARGPRAVHRRMRPRRRRRRSVPRCLAAGGRDGTVAAAATGGGPAIGGPESRRRPCPWRRGALRTSRPAAVRRPPREGPPAGQRAVSANADRLDSHGSMGIEWALTARTLTASVRAAV